MIAFEDVEPFQNTQQFTHPSSNAEGVPRQGLKLREDPVLVEIQQWLFEDTGNFENDILDPAVEPTPMMDEYAKLVLLLFFPYRSRNDLHDGTFNYTETLRYAFENDLLMNGFERILQNVQDGAYNYKRHTKVDDDLEALTHTYRPDRDIEGWVEPQEDEDGGEDIDLVQLLTGDALFDELEPSEYDANQNVFTNLSFQKICECRNSREHKVNDEDISDPVFLSNEARGGTGPPEFLFTPDNDTAIPIPMNNNNGDDGDDDGTAPDFAKKPKRGAIHKLYMTRQNTQRRIPTAQNPVQMPATNGTAKSVVDWARKAKLDKRQTRAFVTILSRFILTFYSDAEADAAEDATDSEVLAPFVTVPLEATSAMKCNF